MSERDSEADQSTTLLCLVLEYLPHNDIAIAGRLTSQDAARHFSSANYRTARLSRSLTPHAAQSFQLHTQPLMRNLTFRKKLGLLAVAAASGSEANMAVAWSLLRPHLFPELLPSQSALGTPALRDLPYSTICGDAGRVACERGHPYLVHWMVQHGCPLSPTPALEAAARHCDLGTLRELWQLLRPLRGAHLDQQVLEAAASSTTPDTLSKMEWVLAEGGSNCQLSPGAAAAALAGAASICSSNVINSSSSGGGGGGGGASTTADVAELALSRLGWLRDRGCPLGGRGVLAAALRLPGDAFLAVVGWLLDNARVQLWQEHGGGGGGGWGDWEGSSSSSSEEEEGSAGEGGGTVQPLAGRPGCWEQLIGEAVTPPGVGLKLRWLQDRGVELDVGALEVAAQRGSWEAVQYLHEQRDDWPLRSELVSAAAQAGSIPTAAWLRIAGCPTDTRAYWSAAKYGKYDMVRWLYEQGRCPLWEDPGLVRFLVQNWNETALTDSQTAAATLNPFPTHGVGEDGELLSSVQLMVGAGCGVDFRALCMAVDRGDLPLVRLLHGTGECRTGRIDLEAAARPGCEALLDFLVEEGYVVVDPTSTCDAAYAHAARWGDLATLRALRRLGVPRGERTLMAAAWGDFAMGAAARMHMLPYGPALCVLRWMVEQGMPLGLKEARGLLAAQQYPDASAAEVVGWLREQEAAEEGGQGGEAGEGAEGGFGAGQV